MKQFFKMFFASLLAMVVAAVIITGLVIGLTISAVRQATKPQKPDTAPGDAALVIDLKDRLHEQSESNSLSQLSREPAYSAGLYEALEAIRFAIKDDRIRCIYLKTTGSPNGWATCQQLRAALDSFKLSKKPIYAYGESISQKDYFIASVADTIMLNPVGHMDLKGLAAELTFYKGTLDKLGVAPEIFYAGKFKSATEPYRTDHASDPNKQQLMQLLGGIWGSVLQAAAQKTGAAADSINQWASNLAIRFPQDAKSYRLINLVGYADEAEALLRKVLELKADEKIPTISLDDYANEVSDNATLTSSRIGLLFAEGEIVDGISGDYQIGSETLVKTIRALRDNEKIKAVVLRVNSPGGSALASEVILRELQLLHAKKPVIVSMGDLAASGGYYISCAADSVFALPNTITGSIGVFSMLFNIAPAAKDKLGVTFDGVKTNPYADFPTASRDLSDAEKARMQEGVDSIYRIFKSRVSIARRLPIDSVDSIAQGRVWNGTDALRIGLIDDLGGLDRAIRAAAGKAKLKEWSVSTYPEPVDRFRAALRRFQNSPLGAVAIQKALEAESGFAADALQRLQWLKKTQGSVLMTMPGIPEIR